jgi:radical SAM superfamily enzyme YgiQ (UPF0313 family)
MKRWSRVGFIVLLILSTVRADVVKAPPRLSDGSKLIGYDPVRDRYVAFNKKDKWFDMWTLGLPDDHPIRRDMRGEREYPPVEKTVLSLRKDFPYQALSRPSMACSRKREKGKFVLINVEQTINEMVGVDDRQYRVWPHLGVIFVGTAAYEEGWDVVIWDELVKGPAPLDTLVEPGDIVGLSLVVTGIERGMDIARKAKELGARYVIAGNDSAIFRANEVMALSDRPIDAVFTSNSLTAVRRFFREIRKADIDSLFIPGVQTMTGERARSNERESLLIELGLRKSEGFDNDDVFVVPKLDLYPHWQDVWANYRATFGHKHKNPETVKNAIALLAQGCTRTRGSDVCSYCTIAGVADIRMPSREYLASTIEAYKAFGIDMVYNTTDSAYEMQSVVNALRDLGAKWNALTIYGRAQGIARNPELLDKWMSVVDDRLLINVGMDSGDDRILQKGVVKSSIVGKGSRLAENKEAVLRIGRSGAHLHYSLIFGSPGETLETCESSIRFLEWTIAVLGSQLDICETDIYWLNFGSPASKVFRDYGYAQELATLAGKSISVEEWYQGFGRHVGALVTPQSVEEAWYRHFTSISLEVAQSFNDRAARIMARHTGSIRGRAFRPT